ncbi:hypothetical protein PybrP1_008418 [[Pythium] brassicae (nom. inval.)]|nr:hypothetical protein PybrP1_008418 [[Pythium] brassicae (nom. inval.)]
MTVVILGLCIVCAYLIKEYRFYYLPESGAAMLDEHAVSPYVAHLRRRSSGAGLKRKASTSLLPALPTTRCEQLCALVRSTLQQHPVLRPTSLEVLDASCAELQYRLLGSKKYWHRSVKQEQHGAKRWEAELYEARCRKSVLEDVESLHWGRVARLASADSWLKHVGYFDSEKAATTASDAAVKARDATNPFTGVHVSKTPLADELATVVQVHIASESFQRMTQRERLRAVYEALVNALAEEYERATALGLDSAVTAAVAVNALSEGADLRGFSGCVGGNVAKLPLWRFLSLHLNIVALTPTQWRSRGSSSALAGDTERFGPSHLANDRALGVNTALLPVSRGLSELVSLNQEDTAARTKSVLPHFYHGLPNELKRMIAAEQAKADAMLERAGDSAARHPLRKNTEATFVKRYLKRRREYVQVALKLQRTVRARSQRRVLREIFLRQRGALTIQRLVRGHRTRKYARAYYRVMTCAALIVQSVYRSHVSREATKARRRRMAAAARDIQRAYQGHLARKFVRWVRRLESSALLVERVARGFMARRRVKRIRAARYKRAVLVPSVVRIQRVYRGHRARVLVGAKRALREKLEVLHPAAVRIERMLRGYLARRLASRFREANAAARRLQQFWRAVRYRKRWVNLMELRRRDRLASKLGAIGRGFVARKFFRREKRKQHLRRVVQPAAAAIQRIFRGYVARKRTEELRDTTEAAITLQQMWRKRSTIKTIRERLRGFRASLREARAAQIQRCYRCYRARAQLLFLRMAYRATYGKAATAIQSAWRSHCSREQLKAFRICALIERKACALTQWKEAREMIELDAADARADLQRVLKYKAKSLRRIKELKAMRLAWERRQPFVAKELEGLTEEDVDRGWGEAFETETHILRFSLELSVEDILSRRAQVREYDVEVDDLRIELDDLERDLEECMLGETMELEAYRDVEVGRARSMVAAAKERNVRVQRIRWRVKSDRKNVVRRQREDLRAVAQSQLASRPVHELGLLAFEKKRVLQLKLEQAIEHATRSTAQQGLLQAAQHRDDAIRSGLNDGLQRMQSIVDEYSFASRVPKADDRDHVANGAPAAMCAGCGRITCDCSNSRGAAAPDATKDAHGHERKLSGSQQSRRLNRLDRRPKYQD